ncbi:MAG: glycine betaine ABC transporter substrate-binding protein [Ktedonobacteraceae bacterium]
MVIFLRSLRGRSLVLIVLMSLLFLAACGGSSGGTTSNGTPSNSSITLTVGGKLDTEAQLLTEMYTLLLRKAGFHVIEKRALGTNAVVFNAITSGQIDLYPEFTATGLAKLGKQSSNNPQQDYQTVKQGYESMYHITWLDPAPLNDTYGVCTTQSKASSLSAMKISDLAPKASTLSVATPPDGKQYGVDVVKSAYGITFKKVVTYNEEGLTFPAVMSGAQDLNICYTTAALIAKDNFVLLQDDKNAFPAYNPAPIVRDDTLKKAPGIATALNPLAPKLTTQVSQQLQAQVVGGKSVNAVATDFLKSQGLL